MEQTYSPRIKISALGGLGENGKNMYILEVDEKLFIFDAGLKNPSVELLGVDYIIPDMTYIKENADRVCGIFLSSGHEDHIGAMPYLLKIIKAPVYGSRLTMSILEDLLRESKININQYKLYKVKDDTELKFGNLKVSFFNTTHSIPETLGISVHTPEGAIVYTGDFTFSQGYNKQYQTSFNRISDISKNGVLCLMNESLGVANINQSDSDTFFEKEINDIFYNSNDRIIVSVYSSDLKRIQTIINTALEYGKKVAFLGRRMQRIVDIAVNLGYLKIPKESLMNLRFIDEQNDNNYSNLVILVTGSRSEPFNTLTRIGKKIDRLVQLEPTDTVIMATPVLQGIERLYTKTIDFLYRQGVNVKTIDKKLFSSGHASKNDVKMMVNMLKPKYVIPVIGEYRHQYELVNVVEEMGFPQESVILLDNGDVAEFHQGALVNKTSNEVEVNEVLIDGTGESNPENVKILERQLLAEDGVLAVSALIDTKNSKILAGPEVDTRGFIYVKNNLDLIEGIKKLANDIIIQQLGSAKGKQLNRKKVDEIIENKISRNLHAKTKRNPVIVTLLNYI